MKRDTKNEIMKVIYGSDFIAQDMSFSKDEYKSAIRCARRTIKYFKSNRIKDGLNYIQSISKQSVPISFTDNRQEVYNARIIIERIRYSIYKNKKIPGKCLESSMAYAAALAKLGFNFDLIVGQHLFLSNKYQFHAWIEVNNQCVNDKRYSNSDVTKIIFKRNFR